MRKLSILFITLLGLFGMTACEDDNTPMILEDLVSPSFEGFTAGGSYVLLKPEADNVFETISWSAANYGMPTGTTYNLQMDVAGNDFAGAVNVVSTPATETEILVSEINTQLIALELPVEVAADVELRLMAVIPESDMDTLYSEVVPLTITPYEAKDPLFVVGGFQGWNNGTALSMNRGLPGLQYELFANISPNEWGFKFLGILGSWDVQYGDDGNNASGTSGILTMSDAQNMLNGGGGNNALDGYYWIQADLKKMTWKCTEVTFGLIGSSTPGEWGSDTDMTYNPTTEQWELTVDLIDGEIKFRANDDWALNFGDSDMDGNLEASGNNIPVTTGAGSYTVTMKLAPEGKYTYTVTKN